VLIYTAYTFQLGAVLFFWAYVGIRRIPTTFKITRLFTHSDINLEDSVLILHKTYIFVIFRKHRIPTYFSRNKALIRCKSFIIVIKKKQQCKNLTIKYLSIRNQISGEIKTIFWPTILYLINSKILHLFGESLIRCKYAILDWKMHPNLHQIIEAKGMW